MSTMVVNITSDTQSERSTKLQLLNGLFVLLFFCFGWFRRNFETVENFFKEKVQKNNKSKHSMNERSNFQFENDGFNQEDDLQLNQENDPLEPLRANEPPASLAENGRTSLGGVNNTALSLQVGADYGTVREEIDTKHFIDSLSNSQEEIDNCLPDKALHPLSDDSEDHNSLLRSASTESSIFTDNPECLNFPINPSASFSPLADRVDGRKQTIEEKLERIITVFEELEIDTNDLDRNSLQQLIQVCESLGKSKLQSTEQIGELFNDFIGKLNTNRQYYADTKDDGTVEYYDDLNDINKQVTNRTFLQVYGLIFKTYAVVIEQHRKDSNKRTTKLRMSVVTSEMFEEAMRHSQIHTIELTYSNIFPMDCRMFIGLPIYRDGYIHQKDQL